MSTPAPGFGQTVAVGIIGADASYRALLQSIVEVAARIFAARAASILIYDVDAHELVFEAAAGRGPGAARRPPALGGQRDHGLGPLVAGADDHRRRHARPAL